MPWIAAELIVDAQDAAPLADALLEQGALSVDVTDAKSGTVDERAIFQEPGEDGTVAWGENRLVALFPTGADVQHAMEQAASVSGMSHLPQPCTYRVEDQDWVRLTQAQFEPITVSDRLSIVPTWHQANSESPITIVMDPGLAFGTGSHPTTHLCLAWLDRFLRPGQTVIDYGCGSGILSIAAAKLGAVDVLGVDIDAQALQASRYNASQNGVQPRFVDAETGAIASADVVIANILSGPLKVLAPLLSRLTRSGGRLVLSGILEVQAEDLMGIYQEWFEMLPPVALEGWVRLEGVRLPG
jgi:ribosomal protein L11 methyltransferase